MTTTCYWVTVSGDRPENWNKALAAGVWGVPEQYSDRLQQVAKGDYLFFYGKTVGAAACRVESDPFVDQAPIWDDVFDGGEIVADVKYKLLGPDWKRTDLYQIVAFAEAFASQRGLVVGFASSPSSIPPTVQVGRISIQCVVWPAREEIRAADAAESVVSDLLNVLT